MEVFISWSGKRSKIFAELFYDLVKRILHPMKPWMSALEIQKGQRWSREIGARLNHDMIGVICVTPENQDSQWLLFESGAISKVLDESRVCPILIGMDKADLKGPLAIVMGAEGQGLRRLSKEHCDFLVKIPMAGSVESLNVSVATGICLFEALRQRNA